MILQTILPNYLIMIPHFLPDYDTSFFKNVDMLLIIIKKKVVVTTFKAIRLILLVLIGTHLKEKVCLTLMDT